VFEGCYTRGEPVAIRSERAQLGCRPLNLGFTVQREQLDGDDGTNRQSTGAEAKSKRRLPVSDVLTNATIRSAIATPEPQPPERAHGEVLVGLRISRGNFNAIGAFSARRSRG
jgi:hypothetical protein